MKNKLKEITESNVLLQSLIANLLIIIGVLIFMKPYLENGADVIMQELVSGDYALGIPTSSILFSHFITGLLLSTLASFAPALPWYMAFHYLLCFIALLVITFLTLKRSSSWETRFLTLAVIIYLGIECYAFPGYVKTACVTSIACFYLILSFITAPEVSGKLSENRSAQSAGLNRTRCIKYMSAAFGLGLISSLISFFVFFAVFMLCAILGLVYLIITRPYDDNKRFFKAMLIGMAVAAGIIILAAAFYYLDRLHYFRDPALSASIAYRLGYEKCLSFGIPSFKFREAELGAARDAIYRLGALDPALVDTNERLLYMAQAHLTLEPHEIFNFLRFEPDNISHVPFIYLWGFLAYFTARYGEKKSRWAVAVSALIGILILFGMRMFLVLGYYRMYTLEIIPFVWFLLLFLKDTHYLLEEAMSGRKTLIMLAVDMVLVIYLSFFLFGDSFPFRWNDDIFYEAELLYDENVSGDEEDTEEPDTETDTDAADQV